MKTYGEIAFTAYREKLNYTTYDGKPIPVWRAIGEPVQTGWNHAAQAVLHNYLHGPNCKCGSWR